MQSGSGGAVAHLGSVNTTESKGSIEWSRMGIPSTKWPLVTYWEACAVIIAIGKEKTAGAF